MKPIAVLADHVYGAKVEYLGDTICRPVCANSMMSMLLLAAMRSIDIGWEPGSGERDDYGFRCLIGSFSSDHMLIPRVRLAYRCGVALG